MPGPALPPRPALLQPLTGHNGARHSRHSDPPRLWGSALTIKVNHITYMVWGVRNRHNFCHNLSMYVKRMLMSGIHWIQAWLLGTQVVGELYSHNLILFALAWLMHSAPPPPRPLGIYWCTVVHSYLRPCSAETVNTDNVIQAKINPGNTHLGTAQLTISTHPRSVYLHC